MSTYHEKLQSLQDEQASLEAARAGARSDRARALLAGTPAAAKLKTEISKYESRLAELADMRVALNEEHAGSVLAARQASLDQHRDVLAVFAEQRLKAAAAVDKALAGLSSSLSELSSASNASRQAILQSASLRGVQTETAVIEAERAKTFVERQLYAALNGRARIEFPGLSINGPVLSVLEDVQSSIDHIAEASETWTLGEPQRPARAFAGEDFEPAGKAPYRPPPEASHG